MQRKLKLELVKRNIKQVDFSKAIGVSTPTMSDAKALPPLPYRTGKVK